MQFQEVVQAIGLQKAEVLFREFRGQRLRIPLKIKPDHKLAVLLSLEAAEQLCAYFPAYVFDFPIDGDRKKLNPNQVEALLSMRRAGFSVSKVANFLGVTRRTVYYRSKLNVTLLQPKKPLEVENSRGFFEDTGIIANTGNC
jgi:Bacterial regulatory protein, Fis family